MAEAKPLVFKKGGKKRPGKGFSLGELKEVKLSLKKALKLGIPADSRRRTVHKENVNALKELLTSKKVSEFAEKEKAKTSKSGEGKE